MSLVRILVWFFVAAQLLRPSEPLPLNLTIGSGSGARGSSVAVSISLSSPAGSEPAALQFRLTFPAGDVTGVTVAAGAAAVAAGKTASCANTTGAVTCLLWGANATLMANGVVAVATVTLSATTPANAIALQLQNAQGTTAGAVPVGALVTGGVITVLAPDTTPPSAPGTLTAVAVSGGQINLGWGAATDNVGVTVYRVERCLGASCTNFAQIGTAAGTSYADLGLTPSTAYRYRVRAQDAANNLGSYSNTAGATTLAAVSGLVAAYGFEEGTGTTTADRSGNNLTGTLQGAAWTAQGRFGNALTFNGTSSAVSIADAPAIDLTAAMTLMAWVYPTANGGYRTVILKEDALNLAYAIYSSSPGGPPEGYFHAGANERGVTAAGVLPLNTWSHLAVTYDGANLRFYVNGVQTGVTAATGTINVSTGPLKIGGNAIWSEWFAGRIDEVRVYNRALSAAEIQTDMNAAVGAAPDTQAPSAPGTPVPTVVSETQIDLSWSAATDNVGVTGYRLERCQGAGCTNFTQVATPAGTSFSDTGLTAGTSYVYRVRAADAAGNLGSYSGSAGATTLAAPAVTGLSCAPATIAANQTTTCTFTLNRPAPAGGFVVSVTSGSPALLSAPATAAAAAGASSGTFTATASATATTTGVVLTVTGGGSVSATVTVSANPCVYSVTSGNRLIAVGGGSLVATVATSPGCAWTATTDAPSWITLQTPSGNGNGVFTVVLGVNLGRARMGTVSVGGQSFKVMQAGSTTIVPFNDVLPSNPFFDYVSLMASNNITAGCLANPPLYCPDDAVTRAQMAVFMVSGLNIAQGTPLTYTAAPYFNDVSSASGFFPFVQKIRDLNITAGCSLNPPLYCPDASITHGQMAVFMIASWMRANNLTTFTYSTTPYFTDVPATHPFFRFIQKMRDMGFWNGCSATQYCESAPVTRLQMAPMILRAILGAP